MHINGHPRISTAAYIRFKVLVLLSRTTIDFVHHKVEPHLEDGARIYFNTATTINCALVAK